MMRRPFALMFSLAAVTAVATICVSSAAQAHVGGHAGGFTNGLAHPLYGLDHILAMVAVGIWASQLGRPALWLLPVTFPLVMSAGALIGWSGLPFPWLEFGIAGSVIALGAVIAFTIRPTLTISTAAIAVFALFHGYEHGAALPANGMPLPYGLGFVLSTLLLHVAGIAIGLATARPSLRFVTQASGVAIAIAGAGYLFVA